MPQVSRIDADNSRIPTYGIEMDDGTKLQTPAGRPIELSSMELLSAIVSEIDAGAPIEVDSRSRLSKGLYILVAMQLDGQYVNDSDLSIEKVHELLIADTTFSKLPGPLEESQRLYYLRDTNAFICKHTGTDRIVDPRFTSRRSRQGIDDLRSTFDPLARVISERLLKFDVPERVAFHVACHWFQSPLHAFLLVSREHAPEVIARGVLGARHLIHGIGHLGEGMSVHDGLREVVMDGLGEGMTVHDGLREITNDGLRLLRFLDLSERRILRTIRGGESGILEFKASLRWDVRQGCINKGLQMQVIREIGAFANSKGGAILVGVNDDGGLAGIEHDGLGSTDRWSLMVTNMVRDHMGVSALSLIDIVFHDVDEKTIAEIAVAKGLGIAYVDGDVFVRSEAQCVKLSTEEAVKLAAQRVPGPK